MTGSSAPERARVHEPTVAPSRLGRLRERVRAVPGGFVLWRVLVTLVGVAVIVIGIVLLPLPGPGWLIIFAGIGVLGTEYAWAKRLLTFAREKVRAWTTWAARQNLFVRLLMGLLTLALLAAIAYVAYRIYI
jgi:uncharacterized protein (TIGR02611 family)